MKTALPAPTTIGEYIATYPPEIRAILERVRKTIRKAAPGAEERIAYRMPSFALNGALVYFGGFKEHVGFYPPVRDAKLQRESASYAGEKGNLRFRYDEPIPYELITRIVKARVLENQARLTAKKR
ncbi:MAG: DUF1801 domain-containing protein [Gemmatimonas sp.]